MKTELILIFKIHRLKSDSFKIIPFLFMLLFTATIITCNSKNLIAQTIVGTIDLGVELEDGFGSFDIAVNRDTNQIYVADVENENVIVIDGFTMTIKDTIKVENLVKGIGVNPETNRIYVPTVLVLDFPTNELRSHISSVLLPQESGITVIDGVINAVIDTIDIGPGPGAIKVNSETNFVYVAGFQSIFVIDGSTNKVIATNTGCCALSPDFEVNIVTNLVYVGGTNFAGAIGIIDGFTNQFVAEVQAGNGEPRGVGVNSATNLIYVSFSTGELSIIDGLTNKVINMMNIANDSSGNFFNGSVIEANPISNNIYVNDPSNDSVIVIDGFTNEVKASLEIGSNPEAISVNPSTNLIYIVESSGKITVVEDVQGTVIDLDANFFTNKIRGNKPLTIQFTDLSMGNPVTWQWGFGDGETSNEQNPIHTYTDEGLFAVSLTVTDNGVADTEIKENLISVKVLNADFSAEPTRGSVPLTVEFKYKSIGTINTSLWDFGDGMTVESTGGGIDIFLLDFEDCLISDNRSTSHEYINEGVFTVSHTITGPGIPGTSTVVKESLITVSPPLPVADFSVGTTNGVVPLSVKFTDESTGTFDTWLWDFGDGETCNEQNPTHVYGEGLFTVSLTVNGTEGSDSKIKEDLISTNIAVVITNIDISESGTGKNVNPVGVEVNPMTNHIYVTDVSNNSLIVIDSDNRVLDIVEVGARPFGSAVNSITNRIYTANFDSNNISVIDGDTNDVIATIDVEDSPRGVTVNSVTNRIYVANLKSNSVSVIDGDNNTVLNTIDVGNDSPVGITVNPETNIVYETNSGNDNVNVINGETNNVIETINVGSVPQKITLNPKTNHIYVVNEGSDNLSVIDGVTNTVIATISVGNAPEGIAVNQTTNRVYVANTGSENITVIDGSVNKVIGLIDTGEKPNFIGVNLNTNSIFITNPSADNVTVLQDDGAGPQPSTMTVDHTIANKSIVLKRATVSVFDENRIPLSGVSINAVASGDGAKVVPSSVETDTDGKARFRFKFGFITENGEIVFDAEGLNATITQK